MPMAGGGGGGGGARSMAPDRGAEMASATEEHPEELAKRREARKCILIHSVLGLLGVVLLLCGLFIPGLPRWARNWVFAPELAVSWILVNLTIVFAGGVVYVSHFGWYVPFNGKKREPAEVTGADLC